MKEIILIKNGEIALKGLNRNTFENIMIRNMRRKISELGKVKITKAQSTIYIEPLTDDFDIDEAMTRLSKVFGINVLCKAAVVEKDFEKIKDAALDYFSDVLPYAKTFKVFAKRSDKKFPMTSPEITRELGGFLLSKFNNLKVDINNPEVEITVEIRDFAAYIHHVKVRGAGGIPVGSSGKAMLLVSGGIDSPVAGYMMAKRGVSISAIHFASPPYTSERAKIKVIDLLKKLSEYCGIIKLYCVPFTEIQEKIRDDCPTELFTIIMRREMMKIAQTVSKSCDCKALITGESVGQVASQTLSAIISTDCAVDMPVLRPVIGMDKEEIIEIARRIGTFDISILPYEDCCTVFTPKHPKTNPKLESVLKVDTELQIDDLISDAINKIEIIDINP